MDFTNYLTLRSSNLATMRATHLALSTLTGSTLSLTTHITVPIVIYSTMRGSTISVSTLTVSSINNNAPGTGTGSFSTLTVSSLVSVSSISSASTIYTSSLLTTGNVGIGTTTPVSQFAVHGNTSTSITVSNGFNSGFFTQYGLAHSAGQYSAHSVAGDTVIDAVGGNLIMESQNKNIYLSMPSTNTSNVLSIAGSGTRPTFSTTGWASLTNTQQYNNISLSWTAPVTCTISSISMYLGQGNNGTNISLHINGTEIGGWWPFQGYGLYVINATGSSIANGVATTPTPFSALNQLIVQAGQVLTIYVSSLQTYNFFYYGRDSTTGGVGFSIVYNAPKVDLSLLNTTTTLSLGLAGVGIGTTAPSSRLTIHANPITTGIGTATFCGVHIQPDGGGVNDQFTGITWSGTSSGNTNTHSGILVQGSGSYGTKMYFQTTDSWVAGTKNRMMIDNFGNVGIGMSNPSYKLDIAGNCRIANGDNSMTYYGPNSTWNSYLVVGAGTDKAGASTAQVISTNGNLHLDAGNGNVMYYGYYSTTRASSNTHQFYGHIHVATSSYMSFGSTTYLFPIYIPYGRSYYFHLYHYLHIGGVHNHNAANSWNVSIWTDGVLVTSQWYGTVSDQRIKKNIQPVGTMLETINKIEIVSFDFIDEPNNKRDECGIIAQQLETVFPNAVDTSTGVIPCYLKFATSQHLVEDDVHILFEYDSTDTQQQFKIGDKIKIHAGQSTADKGSHHVVVKSVIDGGFVTAKWKDYHADDGVFLHGKEVDDFRNVDKEQLGILALKGVQELSSMISTLNGTCASLQASNALLQQENTQLKSQMIDLQAANAATSSQMAALNGTCATLQEANAATSSQMAALLAWARTQGYSS